MHGNITKRLFENLNTRFYHSSSLNKFVTMIYGEISEDTTFRFLSAAHPPPVVFSNQHNRFMEVSQDFCTSFPPIGTLPSLDVIDSSTTQSVLGFKERYQLNEWKLMGTGDILLLYTDGLLEHGDGSEPYFPRHLEAKVREVKHRNAREIFEAIKSSPSGFCRAHGRHQLRDYQENVRGDTGFGDVDQILKLDESCISNPDIRNCELDYNFGI